MSLSPRQTDVCAAKQRGQRYAIIVHGRLKRLHFQVRVHGQLWGQAIGPTKAIARQIAANLALERLSSNPPSAYCTCSTKPKRKGRAVNQDPQLEGSPGEDGDPV